MVKTSIIESFKDYGKCLKITNDVIEAYITIDIGPRIIRFGYVGKQNIMCSNRNAFGPKNDKWFEKFYGEGRHWENLAGHRIWVSPERYPQTYYPDLDAVSYRITENGAIFTPKAETENGIAKSLEIKMDPDDTNMQVIMRIKNISNEDKEFSVWGVTVCEKGGAVIIPMNTNDTGFLHNRTISVWSYTDISSDHIHWNKKYIVVRQNENSADMLKLGVNLEGGTVFYCLNDDIFCKKYDTLHPTAKYPDGGCSFEAFSNENMLEVESLGELKTVKPNETSELIESWSICKKPCEVDYSSDDSIDTLLSKI